MGLLTPHFIPYLPFHFLLNYITCLSIPCSIACLFRDCYFLVQLAVFVRPCRCNCLVPSSPSSQFSFSCSYVHLSCGCPSPFGLRLSIFLVLLSVSINYLDDSPLALNHKGPVLSVHTLRFPTLHSILFCSCFHC